MSLQEDPDPIEMWDTTEADLRHWESQRALLEQRVQRASDIYDDLARRATQMKSRERHRSMRLERKVAGSSLAQRAWERHCPPLRRRRREGHRCRYR